MSGTERSAALRRMGIVEWLPRADNVAVLAVVEPVEQERLTAAPVAAPADARVASASAPSSPRIEATAVGTAAVVAAVAVPSTAIDPTTHGQRNLTAVASPVTASTTSASAIPGLRGRLLASPSGAAVLVLAMAEKSARDAMLQPDAAAGALLNAMLAQLPAPAAVALIGVERGEPIAVPATILVLGERSARLLLGNELAMPLRGRVHLFGQSRVVVSYHPDELRQNGSLKRLAWDDLRLLSGLLNPIVGIDAESR